MQPINNISPASPTFPAAKPESDAPANTGTLSGGAWSYVAQGSSQLTGTMNGHPIIEDPGDWRRHNDVSQLDYAESLAQTAFQVAHSSTNPADILRAQDSLQQAEQIRKQVEQDLTPSQRQTLEQINSEEKQAFVDGAANRHAGLGDLRGAFAPVKMIDAANRSKALDNSILGIASGPTIPILNLPFGKTS